MIDGSKLSGVSRRLKALWSVRSVVLPGALLALYDLRRGILRHVHYSGDAARAEITRAIEAMRHVPCGARLLGDRLFAVPKVFAAVSAQGAWIVARRNRTVKLREVALLSTRSYREGVLEDRRVEVGGTNGIVRQEWRWIRWQKGQTVHEVVTTVLDPARLSAEDVLELYPKRWQVERMFFDLKEVLNLNRIYMSHPNGVAQQVDISALVYTALRVGQGQIAAGHGLAAEALSVPKLFPRLAAVSATSVGVRIGLEKVQELNPNVKLVLPDLKQLGFGWVRLRDLLVEKRTPKRRARRFCKARRTWKSFAHIPGTKKLIKELT